MNSKATKTILITGVSSGLGRALATEALGQGWRVIGTVRKEEDREQFETLRPGEAFGQAPSFTTGVVAETRALRWREKHVERPSAASSAFVLRVATS